jgi:hypothetical protein
MATNMLSSLVLLRLLNFKRALITWIPCFTAVLHAVYLDLSSETFPTFIIKTPCRTSDLRGFFKDTKKEKRIIKGLFARKINNKQNIMKNVVFWDVALCRSCVNRRIGETYRLHLQVRKIRER